MKVWRKPGLAWVLVCLMVLLPALCLGLIFQIDLAQPGAWPEQVRPWVLRPSLGWAQPAWAYWTSAWLHGSAQHLAVNALGLLLLAVMGWRLGLAAGWAACLFLAWPLVHVGLLLDPRLTHYVGASAFLHAGLVIALVAGRSALGPLIWRSALLALTGKVAWEAASVWGQGPTLLRAGADVPVAVWSHVSGVMLGLALAGIHGSQTRDKH